MPIYEYSKSGKVAYYYAFEVKDGSGKRKTIKQRGFKTKSEARNAEVSAREAWNKKTYVEPTKMLFGEYIVKWLCIKYSNNEISELTNYNYEGYIKNHIQPIMGHISIMNITADIIEEFISKLQRKNLASGTIKKIFNLVDSSLRAAVKKLLILRNPVELMHSKPRLVKGEIAYWNKEEVQQFLDSFEHRQKVIFILAIYTGMRQGEILGLHLRDIDFEKGKIYIRNIQTFKGKIKPGAKTKAGNRSITIPLQISWFWEMMKNHRKLLQEERAFLGEKYEDNGLFICTKKGTTFKKHNLEKLWWTLLERSGVKRIPFHGLRHTCASLLFQTDPPTHVKVVQELLGHSSINITGVVNKSAV
jgi:integrase